MNSSTYWGNHQIKIRTFVFSFVCYDVMTAFDFLSFFAFEAISSASRSFDFASKFSLSR
jgi:hypothetical protein